MSAVQRESNFRAAIKEHLELKYGVVGHPKAGRLFELAWEYGHAAGVHEVESYYEELKDLLS